MGEKVHKVGDPGTVAPGAWQSQGGVEPEKHGVVGPGTLAEHGGKRVGRGHSVHGRGGVDGPADPGTGAGTLVDAGGDADLPLGGARLQSVGDQAERAGGSGRAGRQARGPWQRGYAVAT